MAAQVAFLLVFGFSADSVLGQDLFLSKDPSLGGLGACTATVENGTGYGGDGIYNKLHTSSWQECCSLCAQPTCIAWTFLEKQNGICELRSALPLKKSPGHVGKVSGFFPAPPAPPPSPPPPSPPPAPAGSQKNIIFVVTDDQDLRLGSMQAMPQTKRLLLEGGANLTNFFTHTPICCPSRTTMLSGRYSHNNRGRWMLPPGGGCMRMNTSRDENPAFWENSFVKRLHDDHGYTTGFFGKVLNKMSSYGCDGRSWPVPGLDRSFVMCNHNFFNNSWVDDGKLVHTGDHPEDYTTSVMGNRTVEWIQHILSQGPTHPPFFAWVGPHAPHLPATPAPWYADHPVGLNTAPRNEPYYNFSAADHHSFIATEPIITARDANNIDIEYAKRLRSLLSVDDLIAGLADVLKKAGEWDNTYLIFTSDHGYSQGQFRLCSHKMQVYDHGTRVPALVKGPGIKAGSVLPQVTSMVDIAPTIMELAGGATAVPHIMDGHSFAPFLFGRAPTRRWKDTALIEYESIAQPGLGPGGHSKHPVDGVNNTYRALRIVNETFDVLYAEFTDVSNPAGWNFDESAINFWELYNVTEDYYEMYNIYDSVDPSLKERLHRQLVAEFQCAGQSECH